jgi:hypothetical protein
MLSAATRFAVLLLAAGVASWAQDSTTVEKEDDPGRPVLQRGGAAKKRTDSGPVKTDENIPTTIRDTRTSSDEPAAVPKEPTEGDPPKADNPPAAPAQPEVTYKLPGDDELIAKARALVAEFNESLPDFLCEEAVKRYQSRTIQPKWKYLDQTEVELVFTGGKEGYRNIRRNGKPLKKGSPEDTGQWSKGDFSGVLGDLFQATTRADFKLRKAPESTASGLKALVYDFSVRRENSHWDVRATYLVRPAYSGSVWIEPSTGRVLRVEMDTHSLPSDYPVDKVEGAIDYDFVTIGAKKYLMPVRGEMLSCVTGGFDCDKNEIEFRNFRKFQVESQVLAVDSEISFPDEEKGDKKSDGASGAGAPPKKDP